MFKVALIFPGSFRTLVEKMEQRLKGFDFQVITIYSETPIDEQEKRRVLQGVDVYVTGGLERITADALEETTKLRLIQRFGAGYENVDCIAAARKGIYVANIPGANADSVADLTMGLILALVRHIVKADNLLRKGTWRFWIGHELVGKVLGILGLGAIGKAVALRAQAHGMTVIAHDVQPDLEFARKHKVQWVSKAQLLKTADIVTLHMPLTEETRNFISKSELSLMKPTAYLVNTSRGGLIDQTALIEALSERRIAGAALDVFAEEPLPPNEEILELDNVVLTPHIGGSTFEALERLARIAVDNCLRVKRGDLPLYVVNKPLKDQS